MSTSPQTPDCVPPAEEEFVTMSKQQFDDLCRKINPEACGDSLPSTSYSTSVPAPSAKPSFLKPGLEKQFDFNQELYSLVVSGIRHLPEGFPVPPQFMKASTLALQSNELLAAADKDPGIWEFYDQQCKAESFKYNNPILAKYFQEKKKEEKKTSSVGASAKRQFRPYPARAQQPFRFGGATWVLASPPSYPDQTRPSFQKNPGLSNATARPRRSTDALDLILFLVVGVRAE
ncbi:hypothetical protein Q1695_008353 [Nippostrongylus brasiliensis]|nr:hypothetical protein Q1695_008353 [Nippostrongylus brasiliensis]